MEVHEVLIGLVGIIALIYLGLVALNRLYSEDTWFCDELDWHNEPKHTTFDGVHKKGVCDRCGRDIMEDSHGDWITIK